MPDVQCFKYHPCLQAGGLEGKSQMELLWISLLPPTTYVALGKILDLFEWFFFLILKWDDKSLLSRCSSTEGKDQQSREKWANLYWANRRAGTQRIAEPRYWWGVSKTAPASLTKILNTPLGHSLLTLKEQERLKLRIFLKTFSTTIPPLSDAWFFAFFWFFTQMSAYKK